MLANGQNSTPLSVEVFETDCHIHANNDEKTMFRFRKIPGLTVTTSHFISEADGRYNIINAEDVRGRGMYIEVLAEKLEGTVR